MDSAKNQLIEKLKTSNNILVTVSRNPSVDQLAACLGLTLVLNKLGKHGTAVYSGETPSTIEFLKPEETLEKTTDSLRDFIISLDKSKADKLRYKLEDDVVRIFITPYRSSITEEDFDFSQGDFNVDVVVALGVTNQEDIDSAITAHGRILHDATVASINLANQGELGVINWVDPAASSLSELVTELGEALGENLLDQQISTALLTGIVAETQRFSNDKTSSETMRASSVLMAAGADQQLVAAKLEEKVEAPVPVIEEKQEEPHDDGMIEIDHASDEPKEPIELPEPEEPEVAEEPPKTEVEEVKEESKDSEVPAGPGFVTEPPSMGGQLTANTQEEGLDPSTDPLSMMGGDAPILKHDAAPTQTSTTEKVEEEAPKDEAPTDAEVPVPAENPAPADSAKEMTPPPSDWMPPKQDDKLFDDKSDQKLDELEHEVRTQEEDARQGVAAALNGMTPAPEAIEALNAQPLGGDLHPVAVQEPNIPAMDQPVVDADPTAVPSSAPVEEVASDGLALNTDPGPAPVQDPNAPPSVPPPIPFQFGTTKQ